MPKRQEYYPVWAGKTQSSFYSPTKKKLISFDWLNRGMQTRRDSETGQSYIAGFFSSFLRREK